MSSGMGWDGVGWGANDAAMAWDRLLRLRRFAGGGLML